MTSKNSILKKKWLLSLNQDIDPLSVIQQLIEVEKFFTVRQTITPPAQNSNILVKIWIEVKEPRDDSFIKIKDELPTLQSQSGEGVLKKLAKDVMKLAKCNQADYITNLLMLKILYKQMRFILAPEVTRITSIPPLLQMLLY